MPNSPQSSASEVTDSVSEVTDSVYEGSVTFTAQGSSRSTTPSDNPSSEEDYQENYPNLWAQLQRISHPFTHRFWHRHSRLCLFFNTINPTAADSANLHDNDDDDDDDDEVYSDIVSSSAQYLYYSPLQVAILLDLVDHFMLLLDDFIQKIPNDSHTEDDSAIRNATNGIDNHSESSDGEERRVILGESARNALIDARKSSNDVFRNTLCRHSFFKEIDKDLDVTPRSATPKRSLYYPTSET